MFSRRPWLDDWRVVDEDVHGPVRLRGGGDEYVDLGTTGDIAAHGQRRSTSIGDLLCHSFHFLQRAASDDNAGALGGEGQGDPELTP